MIKERSKGKYQPEAREQALQQRVKELERERIELYNERHLFLIDKERQALEQRVEELEAQKHQAVGDVAELIERLNEVAGAQHITPAGWETVREAASHLAALQQRVEELEKQRLYFSTLAEY